MLTITQTKLFCLPSCCLKTRQYYNAVTGLISQLGAVTPLREYYIWWSQEMSTDLKKKSWLYHYKLITSYLIHVSLVVRTKSVVSSTARRFYQNTSLLSSQSLLSTCSHKSLPRIVSELSLGQLHNHIPIKHKQLSD